MLLFAMQAMASGRIYYAGTLSTPYIWAWTGDQNVYQSWPGQPMTKLPDAYYYGRTIYYVDIDGDCPANAIFSSNGSDQTANLDIPGYEYVYTGSSWMPYTHAQAWFLYGDFEDPFVWHYSAMQGAGDQLQVTLSLAAGREYYFKVASIEGVSESLFSCGTTLTRTTCAGADFSADGANAALATTIAGNYVFTFDTQSKTLSVTYPDALPAEAVNSTAVPAENEDVLIQAYYWAHDGNTATPWTPYGGIQWTDLNAQAAELGEYFDLVWLAPSAATADYTGFLPRNYSNQNNVWGTETELRTLINSLHNAGAKVVADIVINHSNATGGFCTWDAFNFDDYGTYNPDRTWIANDDEIFISNTDSRYKRYDIAEHPEGVNAGMKEEAGSCGDTPSAYADENTYTYGESNEQRAWSYAEYNCVYSRDWAHRLKEVREMCRAYLTWMNEEIGYDGWRYDFAKGIHGSHLDDYNKASNAAFSVAEIFDGDINKEIGMLRDAHYNTYVFDFPAKYQVMNEGIRSGNYSKLLGNASSTMLYNYKRYTVTFVDNHDTFREDYNICGTPDSIGDSAKVIMANAYILSMPGVPCVFYPYWHEYKVALKAMIDARRSAGVHSESAVQDEAGEGYYRATVTGKHGTLRLLLGPNSGYQYCPEGYTAAYVGKDGVYAGVYYQTTGQETQTVYFLDSDDSWTAPHAYIWNAGLSNGWPGADMTLEGTFDGHKLYSYTYNAGNRFDHIIFNNGSSDVKTADLTLTAGQCYIPNDANNDSGWTALNQMQHHLDMSASAWASLYLPLQVSLPNGLYGYYASAIAGGTVTLNLFTEGTIPAHTGVMLNGAEGAYTLSVSTDEVEAVSNLLDGTKQATNLTDITTDGAVYILSKSQTQSAQAPVFAQFIGSTIPAAKAYLPLESALNAPETIRFVINTTGEATGLGNTASQADVRKLLLNGQILIVKDGVIYNTLGQRIR